ncbi:AzlC family ABC transporter permease [Albimonas pacifica]|uniref:Predicted branched-chain amino acid permease (Azaleucine resistance) n=1 Tax=Albimonas pacifica TaxID=1114924 RepID=A0A1I3F267_9RHOB|nr:AzlC family ABC transporter permease [Albimonas pacifica]SFI05365.1 Predicted branched-chain amino acid permease (azaleucine resistance) [Albimonas pacifica]
MSDLAPRRNPSAAAARPVGAPDDAPGNASGEDPAFSGPLWRVALEGTTASLPFIVSVIPFGMLFGAVATAAGLDPLKAMVLTVAVIAGASQFAFIELLSDQAPVIVAVAAALAVNLRMAMYSASLAPHIGKAPAWVRLIAGFFVVDQVYGLSMRRWAVIPHEPLPRKLAFYFGVAVPMSSAWVACSALGLAVGGSIPGWLPVDFMPPAMFLAIVAPMIRGTANICAALAAVAASLALAWAPWNLGLIVAAAVGMGVGAAVEIRLARRSAGSPGRTEAPR